MKKVSLLTLLLAAMPIMKASAQPEEVPCPCPQAFQGFHLGGNIGYGFGGAKVTQASNFPGTNVPTARTTDNIRVKGVDGGLNLGYTHRFCNFGLGLEGVFNWTNSKGINTTGQVFPNGSTTASTQRIKLNNSFQLRANFSYIFNRIAPKIILGWDSSKWTRFFSAENVFNTSFNATQKKRYNGFLFGAGVDFLLTSYLIAGAEYTCIVSGKKSFQVQNAVITQTITVRPQYNKFALVLKFIY
jgi:opacity protein-like surface antigen